MGLRYFIVLHVVGAAAGFIPAAFAAENPAVWRTYHNERYGVTIDYPDFFRPQPPPDSDDGRTFKSVDGAEFLVFASFNTLDFDLAGFRDFTIENLSAGEAITYQARGGDWFVISGTKGADGVFYERHLLSHGGQMTNGFVITYPSRLKQKYDPIVARMSKSFRPGVGYQTPSKP